MTRAAVEVIRIANETGAVRDLVVVLRRTVEGAEYVVMASQESLLQYSIGELPQISLECGQCCGEALEPVADAKVMAVLLDGSEMALQESSEAVHYSSLP